MKPVYMMPAVYFLAFLEGLLREGPGALLYVLGMTVCVPVCMILLLCFHAAQLGVKGIRPVPF